MGNAVISTRRNGHKPEVQNKSLQLSSSSVRETVVCFVCVCAEERLKRRKFQNFVS